MKKLDVIRTCALLHDIGKLECWANRKPWSEHVFYTYKFVKACLGEEIAVQAMRHHTGPSYTDEYRPRTEIEKIVCLADNFASGADRREEPSRGPFIPSPPIELTHVKIQKNQEPEPYLIADLINNAKRRAEEEQKYDDAIARLYRTIELIAQYRLKTKYKIDPSQAKIEEIPEELLKKWNIPPTETVKLPLEKVYELLKTKNDELGQKYLQDKKLRNLLSKRNTSILAHGLTPVTKETYKELHQKTIEYAKITVKNLDILIETSKFIKWKE